MSEKKMGTITHFFDKISVGIIKLDGVLKIGDKVKFQGSKTNFEQEITEMQIEHEKIEEAKKGQEVGIKVNEEVREGDEVFLL
ncbi:translation elongation factor-like protein [candidate division WWE3 bacterium]|uniref:Translation elongation factor-like protein n=1 Tax=candidate division WWE3 bacterium TaxID=2053526 RepID=A0A7X9HSU0_UNCKA|nr:translation elongation factor-like protein [candidate division WWE3 bacterium]